MSILTRLLKYPFQGRFAGQWRWPQNISQDDWTYVRVPTRKQNALVAVLGSARQNPKGTLLLAHPIGRTAKGFWLKYGHADRFRNRGFHVLAIDFNGYGESPDTSFDYPADVEVAALWLREKYPDLACGAVGTSFGGAWLLCAMARRKLFDAVLIESTFSKLRDFWGKYPLPNLTLRLSEIVFRKLERSMRPEIAVQSIKGECPVTLLYSKTDVHTPLSQGEKLATLLGTSTQVDLIVADNAEHTHIYRDAKETYIQAVEKLEENLAQASSSNQSKRLQSEAEKS